MKYIMLFFIVVTAVLTAEEKAIIERGKKSAEEISILGRGYASYIDIRALRIKAAYESKR